MAGFFHSHEAPEVIGGDEESHAPAKSSTQLFAESFGNDCYCCGVWVTTKMGRSIAGTIFCSVLALVIFFSMVAMWFAGAHEQSRGSTTTTTTSTLVATSTMPSPEGSYVLRGLGPGTMIPNVQRWGFAWTVLHPSCKLDYASAPASTAVDQLIAWDFSAVDFVVADAVALSAEQQALLDARQRSLHAALYSLNGVTPLINGRTLFGGNATASVRLSRDALVGLFNGEISSWDDLLLQQLNPDLVLPQQPVKVVLRPDDAQTTLHFTTLLRRYAGPTRWPWPAATTWPAELVQALGSRVVWSPAKNAGEFAAVVATPYSVGYVVQSLADMLGEPSYVTMLDPVTAQPVSMADGLARLAATATVDPSAPNYQLSLDFDAAGVWPLAKPSYVLLPSSLRDASPSECRLLSLAYRWVIWTMTDPVPRTAHLPGNVLYPADVVARQTALLTATTCGPNDAHILSWSQ